MRELLYDRTHGWHSTPIETIALAGMLVGIVLLAGRISGKPVGLIFAVVAFLGYLFDAHLYVPAAILIAVIRTFFSWRRRGMSINHHARQWSTLLLDLAIAGVGFLLYELGRIATSDGERMALPIPNV